MGKFCTNCGAKLEENQDKCVSCGKDLKDNKTDTNTPNTQKKSSKSKVCAGLLGIFLGSLGVHNFYLGFTSKAVAQLLLTLVGWIACGIGPMVASIWGLIEGIMILTGNINKDSDGNELID